MVNFLKAKQVYPILNNKYPGPMLEELDQGRQVLFYKFSITLFGLLSVNLCCLRFDLIPLVYQLYGK